MDAPDPQRLGGLAWVRRTGGRLSRTERRKLFIAIAVGQWENAVGRAKLALGRLPAAAEHVDLDAFRVPDSSFAREAEEACAELPPTLQGHSYRTWLFGHALATVDGHTMDDELFYCGALLHDYGIVSPTANRDFTLGSVERMLSCAGAAGVDDARADLLADGICVHTTPVGQGRHRRRHWLLPAVGGDGRRRRTAHVGRRSPQRRRGAAPLPTRRFQEGARRHDACRGEGGPEGTLRAPRTVRLAVGRADGAVRLLRSGGRPSSQPLVEGGAEVPGRALVPAELHEVVCGRVQPALYAPRHLVVVHETGSDEA